MRVLLVQEIVFQEDYLNFEKEKKSVGLKATSNHAEQNVALVEQ
jgi:hypothetical protein